MTNLFDAPQCNDEDRIDTRHRYVWAVWSPDHLRPADHAKGFERQAFRAFFLLLW
jgi:hypothetical protein